MRDSRVASSARILVRRPSPRLALGELTHRTRMEVDPVLALAQWRDYVAAFAARGWDVTEVEPADEHPDGVFIEDSVVVFGDFAVLTSPGAASRQGEVASTERALNALRAEGAELTIARIGGTGRLDGGDVLKVGATVYVGKGSRTNADGIRQLTALVEARGYRVITVPISKVLHLKSGVTALPDGTVVGFEPLVDGPRTYPEFLPVPEEHGAAVVDLGDDTVLMSADAPQTADLFRARGLSVVTVPITEFEKLEGCVTCLSMRLR